MHTQQHECVEVLPEDTSARMPYFTLHKHTGAHHLHALMSYKNNLSNECFIIYFTAMRTPQCMCVCFIRLCLLLNASLHTSQT
jgi:hypothetical protein